MSHKCIHAYTCDRCGKKFGEVEQGAPIAVRIRQHKRIKNGIKGFLTIFFYDCNYSNDYYELCEDCMGSLKAWISNPKLDKRTLELSGEAKEIYDGMLREFGHNEDV